MATWFQNASNNKEFGDIGETCAESKKTYLITTCGNKKQVVHLDFFWNYADTIGGNCVPFW